MAESLDDGDFWLPSQFLTDDNMFMDNKSNNNCNRRNANDEFVFETEYPKPLFPFDFPYGFGSVSPVEYLVGSAEESDEEDYMSGLTCKLASAKLEDDFKGNVLAFGYENSKVGLVSGSPQSTLRGAGSGCRGRQGSSNGSPNESARVSSPPATWDLLYAAAGEVSRMRKDEEGRIFNSRKRGILGPPRIPYPVSVSVPVQSSNPDLGFYQKLQAAQFHQLRQRQMMKQQQGAGAWGCQGQSKGGAAVYHAHQQAQVVQSRGRNANRPLVLCSSAWPLQSAQRRQNRQGGSGMRALFLGNPTGAKRECVGTGVFLPRRAGAPPEPRNKPACSTVLLPARVVQALNLNLDDMGTQQTQFQNHRCNGNFIPGRDNVLRLRNCNVVSHQNRNFRPQPNTNEVRLPQEWSY